MRHRMVSPCFAIRSRGPRALPVCTRLPWMRPNESLGAQTSTLNTQHRVVLWQRVTCRPTYTELLSIGDVTAARSGLSYTSEFDFPGYPRARVKSVEFSNGIMKWISSHLYSNQKLGLKACRILSHTVNIVYAFLRVVFIKKSLTNISV